MSALVRTLLLTLAAAAAFGASGDAAPRGSAAGRRRRRRQAARAGPGPAPDIEDFVPSEKVKADDAVSFPTGHLRPR